MYVIINDIGLITFIYIHNILWNLKIISCKTENNFQISVIQKKTDIKIVSN